MTPEEKFNQDVWWILQEIKKDSYLTPKGQRVEFSLRSLPKTKSIRRKDVDYGFPQEGIQRKLLFKLQEWKALDDVKAVDDILRGSDIFNPHIYQLTIEQPKFDELYKKFQNACDINSWLNTKQEKMFQNLQSGKDIDENVQKFLEVEKNFQLSTADRKKLCILEKLKEEWDLLSKKDGEINISWQKLIHWEEECGVDYDQLKNILQGFLDENLIVSFNLYNPAR